MRVLIVKVSALGDVVHTLPVLAYLHSACPNIEIDWLVEEGFAPILQGHPLITQVIPLQTKQWRKLSLPAMLRQIGQFILSLRQQRYDLVFDLQGNSKSGLFTLFSRSKAKYGFDRHQVREWPNLLATNHKVALGELNHHVAQRSLALIKAALPDGDDLRSVGPLHVLPTAKELITQQLGALGVGQQQLIVLHYGTTWGTKLWSLECWQQLAQRLLDESALLPILTWGNDAEQRAAQSIADATAGRAVVWPRGSLPELVALLERVDIVVGCDTGPIHIAAALGTPTVSVYRVTDGQRNGPVGAQHRCLQSPLSCSPCLRKKCNQDAQCAISIRVADVYQAIMELTKLEYKRIGIE
jgi:heptosyltransferase-1